ncbi:CBS domain-containing protein [Syntrophothermus lipocalidus]|uniref:Diguanylate cyclase n=1 Tax=Syntrophothermus lipocalidus (strain DSM 12680 / TGB-C1) TaxID=643648 RepID=D7CN39_SYNLT|nr:CBS domain-containing protein [Syntrophothermus lipocalidus]ADI02124.1 diguanylate cyclase [Syntrophothermus lipocalidus DSM 12680]
MGTLKSIMVRDPVTVSPDASVARAVQLMQRFKVGGLPVVQEGMLVGILTSRDVRNSHPNRLVADAMTREVITISPDCSIWEAKEKIDRYCIERLVVEAEGRLLGIITKSCLLIHFGKAVDSLTGLFTADYAYYAAEKLLKTNSSAVVIFIDLDNFGEIDKQLGHAEGNSILVKVAQALNSGTAEEVDYLCRYGGDEFVVVTSRNVKEAQELCFSLLDAISNVTWPGLQNRGLALAASAGIVPGRRSASDKDKQNWLNVVDLVNLASLGSTQAKQKGHRVLTMEEVEVVE